VVVAAAGREVSSSILRTHDDVIKRGTRIAHCILV
jgi:hypothetical protein